MCGIAGLMTRDGSPPREDFLAILSKTLVHRGPDGVGNYIKNDIGLCHRRLAVIDLFNTCLINKNGWFVKLFSWRHFF